MFLREARQHCDYLIVGLHTDPSIERPWKSRPVETVEERRMRLESCRYVDEVIEYTTEADLLNLLHTIQPDIRFIGSDWRGKPITGAELGIPIYYHERNHDYSSTNLRKRIRSALRDE